jgi:hypothetical protein
MGDLRRQQIYRRAMRQAQLRLDLISTCSRSFTTLPCDARASV